MDFEPRVPLVLAETFVDFPRINSHILEKRQRVEQSALPYVRRLVFSIVELGVPSQVVYTRLQHRLERELERTVHFGYAQAQGEIAALRIRRPATVLAYSVPDAGRHGRIAQEGVAGVLDLMWERARATAAAVVGVALVARREQAVREPDKVLLGVAVMTAAAKELHKHVLELVGEALNLGRSAGALRYPQSRGGVPEFAMRSEQLDKRTCSACEGLHGTITSVGSSEYYSYLPPSGCYGGGRCRAVMVFHDGPEDVRGPETEPGQQPSLPPLDPSL